ncbi:MAG: glycerol-3-phosphate dehydrogenase/oxidase, partial [Caldilineaceae bacterium]|nr:glycerol-3-phosphate dehydrogenase/oxidase [Caldilineaceae bacterium]
MNRQEKLQALTHSSTLDVLIIGAGVNGIGTFRDLALQGINILLVDRADFCSGASAASSHMAHGGIRYLENGEFRLVREAVQERNRLIQNAPHYVQPLPTVIPIFKWLSGMFNAPFKFLGLLDKPSERGAAIIKMGLTMYDAYTGAQRTVPRHEVIGRAASMQRYPQLNPNVVCTAQYYDGLIHAPERLCMEMIIDGEAANPNARALNYVRVESAAGATVRLRDEQRGETFEVQPRLVVNAAGPWIDFANDALGRQSHFIGGTKGSHLVLDHPELRQAIGEHEFFFENADGRIVLICPLLERVLVGTSDIRLDDPDQAVCTDDEIDYFLGMIKRVFPQIVVTQAHIVFTFSGVRPLPSSKANTTGQISRDHSIETLAPDGNLDFPILNLVGGKWTTFRAFSAQVADALLARLGKARQKDTASLAIGGGAGYPQSEDARRQWVNKVAQEMGLPADSVDLLFVRYGTYARSITQFISEQPVAANGARPLQNNATYLRGEIAFLAAREQIVHLEDLLLRRTSLAMLGHLTRPLLDELAEIVGEVVGWPPDERASEIARC